MTYRAPVAEIAFTLKHAAGLDEAMRAGRYPDLSEDVLKAILTEAGRFAEERVAPQNRPGDIAGARLENGAVIMPEGWKALYRDWIAGGWNGLTAPPEYGGQGLPLSLFVATFEMWNSGSLAFALGPTLTVGAIEALLAHASEALKARYLPRIVSGEWMATMNLTEPQAGSDLGELKTRAERADDGSYRIFGQKIFITYGEHDLTDNIIHMVLARLPDAPAGTRGISLFLVPKFLTNEDGSLGKRNDVRAIGLEHKLGIHASPTCTMAYGEEGGAVGYLVGEEHRGLAAMFTMMNNARLAVGVQGVAVAERAFQQALAYARERRQGRAPGAAEVSAISEHADVRRMLMTMKTLTMAARAICHACAGAIDRSRAQDGEPEKWHERAGLLTPVAKAFSTDVGVEVASLGIQVHGGLGYIEETGMAQLFRDSRIPPIYEGTNGIQAIDLVARKLPQSDGAAVAGYLAELDSIARRAEGTNRADLGRAPEILSAALADLGAATDWLLAALREGRRSEALAGATPYLRLFGLTAGGAYLVDGALAADEPAPTPALAARFFAENLLVESAGLRAKVTSGAESVLAADPSLLAS